MARERLTPVAAREHPPRPRAAIREAGTQRQACSTGSRPGTARTHPAIAMPRSHSGSGSSRSAPQHVVTRVLLAGTAIVPICWTRSRHAVTPGSPPTASPRTLVPPTGYRRQPPPEPRHPRRHCPSPRIRRGMKNCRASRRYSVRESLVRVAPTDHSQCSTQVPPTGIPTAKAGRRFFFENLRQSGLPTVQAAISIDAGGGSSEASGRALRLVPREESTR